MAHDQPTLVTLPDGRRLACAEAGDPAGVPVFAFHGLPGSRLQQHPDASIALARRARMIHFDRPGFGLSTPHPGRTLASCAADVAAAASRLGIERFAVAGVSGGGPFAVACAALLPERVTRLALVSSVGPPGSMRGARMTAGSRAAFFLAPRAPWLMSVPVRLGARLAARSPGRFLDLLAAQLTPEDQRTLARPDVRAMLLRDIPEAVRQGVDAILEDLRLEARPWQLPLDAIRAPVALWHGDADRVVPSAASRHLAGAIPGARADYLPGAGHFMIFERWPEVLDWLAA